LDDQLIKWWKGDSVVVEVEVELLVVLAEKELWR
jgi:hypothetical protein